MESWDTWIRKIDPILHKQVGFKRHMLIIIMFKSI